MSTLKGYVETLKGALAVHDACKFNFGGIPNALKIVSPQFRMFLDSDIDSPIEDVVKKMWADSIVGGVRSHFPKNSLSQKIATGLGTWIGEKSNSFMDRVKLMHQYHQGQISIDQYLDKRSTQVQASLVNVAHKAKSFSWVARQFIHKTLEEVGVPDPETTIGHFLEATGIRRVTKGAFDGIENAIKSEKTRELLQAGIATFHAGLTTVAEACKTVKERVVEPVLQTVARAAETTVDVVSTVAKQTWDDTKKTIGKVWKWITRKR